LEVVLTTSDEVLSLREQVKVLTEQLDHLQQDYNRVELLYRSESVISMELLDLLRENGIPVREAVKRYKKG
jgi:hypothetical protein